MTGSGRPLFVSEGTSRAKLSTIRGSQYLSWCLDRLRTSTGDTVVFGHSLAPQDQHVMEALVAGGKREIAISVWPDDDPRAIIEQKAHLRRALEPHTVHFFDSTTHPLGLSSLTLQSDLGASLQT
ncbi:DUF4917 family protein [Pseudactinotalea terrae]|uniref:DUF4917 family protein n=1 Tax=Pseudactinotalea terrae TaxID=1743262 RepID=UPI001390F63C|nr:DUF4917 family protein [Pseudactinotalea terrae]